MNLECVTLLVPQARPHNTSRLPSDHNIQISHCYLIVIVKKTWSWINKPVTLGRKAEAQCLLCHETSQSVHGEWTPSEQWSAFPHPLPIVTYSSAFGYLYAVPCPMHFLQRSHRGMGKVAMWIPKISCHTRTRECQGSEVWDLTPLRAPGLQLYPMRLQWVIFEHLHSFARAFVTEYHR